MSFNLLAFAVPIFITFIFIEYWVARRQGKEYFSFAHSVSNLNVGIVERLSDVFVTLEIGYSIRKAKNFGDKLRILFGRPDVIDPNIRGILERKFRIRSTQKPVNGKLNRYVLWQIAFTLSLLFVFILFDHYQDWLAKTLVAGIILTTVINCGAILEQRKWIFQVELIRASVLGIAMLVYFPIAVTVLFITAILIISAAQYQTLEQHYLRLVYRRV